jgi:hypothetical protein
LRKALASPFILQRKHKRLVDVNDETDEEHVLHRPYQPVVAHEVCAFVKGQAVVVEENERVEKTVYQQERHQKKSGCAHDHFLPY